MLTICLLSSYIIYSFASLTQHTDPNYSSIVLFTYNLHDMNTKPLISQRHTTDIYILTFGIEVAFLYMYTITSNKVT